MARPIKLPESLDELRSLKALIEAKEKELVERERGVTLDRIRRAMLELGLTTKDLSRRSMADAGLLNNTPAEGDAAPVRKGGMTAEGKARMAQKLRERGKQIKYRHPETGEEWSGLRLKPAWVKAYLKKRGHKLEDLLTPEFREG